MNPTFFPAPSDFRAWLEANHASEDVLWVGLYKRGSGRPSITWPQAVDEALCFGWIDGLRRSLGAEAYMIRFTPRKPTSTWSAKNIARMEELIAEERVHPAGRAAYARRTAERSGVYSFEQEDVTLGDYEGELRADAEAWAFFQAQPPYYRRTATWWVISAKREATRRRRLATLIADSAAGRRVAPLRRTGD